LAGSGVKTVVLAFTTGFLVLALTGELSRSPLTSEERKCVLRNRKPTENLWSLISGVEIRLAANGSSRDKVLVIKGMYR